MLSICSTTTQGAAISAASDPAEIGLAQRVRTHVGYTWTHVRSRSKSATRPAAPLLPVVARPKHSLHDLLAWPPSLRRTRPQSRGPIVSHHARDACSRVVRGCAFDRRSRAHLDGLRPVLLHVPRASGFNGRCLRERPRLRLTRPRAAAAHASSQHTCISRGAGQRDA